MKNTAIESKEWVGLDYAEFNQANFNEMKWRYSNAGKIEDIRDLKRISATYWQIMNDNGVFHSYVDYCGEESEEGKLEVEIIEGMYQEWLKNK